MLQQSPIKTIWNFFKRSTMSSVSETSTELPADMPQEGFSTTDRKGFITFLKSFTTYNGSQFSRSCHYFTSEQTQQFIGGHNHWMIREVQTLGGI